MLVEKERLLDFFRLKSKQSIFYSFNPIIQGGMLFLALGKVSKKIYGIFLTLVGWVGLKKSFSIKNKNDNKKHGLKMPKIA